MAAINTAKLDTVTANLVSMGIAVTGVDEKTGFFTTSVGTLVDETGKLVDPLNGAVTATDSLAASFNSGKTAADNYASAIASTQTAIDNYNKATGGLFKNADATGGTLAQISAGQNTALGGGAAGSNDQPQGTVTPAAGATDPAALSAVWMK